MVSPLTVYCRWFNLRNWISNQAKRMVEIWYQFPCTANTFQWQLVVFTHFQRFSFCILRKFLKVQFFATTEAGDHEPKSSQAGSTTTSLYDCQWNDADWEAWDGNPETMPDQGFLI